MQKIFVAGIGTDVGKTVVSAILTLLFDGEYWKPIQCGSKDTETMQKWIDPQRIHPPTYSFKAFQSPHHAARLEKVEIQCNAFHFPQTSKPLIIEGVGGIFVPLTTKVLSIQLFASWKCNWVVVSNHYLGSINHTLLTIEALKQKQIPILGIIFNGKPNLDSEVAILAHTKLPLLGRLLPENNLTTEILNRYAIEWRPHFL